MRWIVFGAAALATIGACAATSHPVRRSNLGEPRSTADLLAVVDSPGPVIVETVNAADWATDRSGLVNLKDPRAESAGLEEGLEPIQVYFYALRHPTQGLFLVDTGVENAVRDNPDGSALSGLVWRFMHIGRMQVHAPLGEWLKAQTQPLKGVFLTHLHFDHSSGIVDVPAETPVYMGPGEAEATGLFSMLNRGTTDRVLDGKGDIQEWPSTPDPSGRFDAVADVFGDGSVWALWVPGHTPGSTAYLARTPKGAVLFTGDTCITKWGWEHDVEPGSFTMDHPSNVASLAKLRRLVAEHPGIDVRLGHQLLDRPKTAAAQP
jgi:glyoxylase-like metal-dependent hydrolase (beta-lactamase superfamily II)